MLRLVESLAAHEGICWHVSWDHTGEMFATCGQDRLIKLWRCIDGKYVCVFTATEAANIHSRTIRRVAWRPDSKCLVAVSFDSTCSVWKVTVDYKLVYLTKISGQENEVKGVCFSPCGELLATCSRDKSIWIFDVSTLLNDGVYNNVLETVSGSDDEFSVPTSPVVARLEVDVVAVLQGHSQDVKNVIFFGDSKLISVSYDDTVRIWTAINDNWELAETLRGHSNTVWDVSVVENNTFVTVSADGSMKIWSPTQTSPSYTPAQLLKIRACTGGPLGAVSRRAVSQTWTPLTTQVTSSAVADVPPAPIYSVHCMNALIALACGDNTVRIYTYAQTIPVCTIKTSSEPTCVAFQPSSAQQIAVSLDEGTVGIYTVSSS